MKQVELNKQTRLSEHFTLAELCKTSVKKQNVPNEAQGANLRRLCQWLEELRRRWNNLYGSLTPRSAEGRLQGKNPSPKGEGNEYKEDPIIINSGFRSPEVNRAVGGAPNSNHLTGCAADIRVYGMEQAIRYACILLDISDIEQEDFDELIIEKKGSSLWIHFAVRPSGNRRKVRLLFPS